MIPVQAVHHVGIAVRSIDERRPFYERTLGAIFEACEEVPSQGVRVAFLRAGGVYLELLEPLGPTGPIAKFLETRGEGLHHVAFRVGGIADRLAELDAEGVRLIDKAPRPGAHGSLVGFLHPSASGGVLVELCEPEAGD